MTTTKADLFLHPIRLRIITAISTQRMTAGDIARTMPDVPQTTLYRNINALAAGGIIELVEERQVRGTVERVYALTSIPSLNDEDLQGMSRDDFMRAFTTYLSTLVSDASRYLDEKPTDEPFHIVEDGVVVSRIELFLTQEENRVLVQRMQELLMEAGGNEPSPGRKRHVWAHVVIPSKA
jgi:DNA-binding transcriptional ArsR family regulator